MRAAIGIVTLAAVVAVAGCASGDDGSGVRPFSEVQDSELVFENDPTFPGRGIFRVTTTEPMICAIVWGETEALGNFNNSLAMNGTGIVQHDVLLPGAQPGGTYFYRVQGSTADGALYQSPIMTFTLPEADDALGAPVAPVGENLALGATVAEVSSEFGPGWTGENAIDGDLTTEWSSGGDGDNAFISVDLGESRTVESVEFVTRSMADGTATTNTYWVVVDGGERTGPFAAGDPATPAVVAFETSGQLFRFEVDSSTGGNTGAVEIRIFAASP